MSVSTAQPVVTSATAARHALQRCIRHCANAKDERGRWRAAVQCQAALDQIYRPGSAANQAAATAARRLGAWLAGVRL